MNKNQQHESLSEKEFKEAFDQYFEAIRNYIYFLSSKVDLAEDLAQDTFIKLWDTRDKIVKKTIKSYLYAIARNLTINHLKREKLKYTFVSQQDKNPFSESPEYVLLEKEFKQKLENALAELPEGNREVFLMNRIEGLKYAEIAERIGLSVKAVEKRMSKAIRILKDTTGYSL